MYKTILILVLALAPCFNFLPAQNGKVTLSGTVKDGSNGEDLAGAYVVVKDLPGTGAISNDYGFYSIDLPPGTYTLTYSFLGFEKLEITVEMQEDRRKDAELKPEGTTVEEVIISAEVGDENVTSTEMSVARLDLQEIKNIPVLFGERDIMKTIQLLPGISTGGEGNGGLYVRGGSSDQNLILLDEAPVYNPSHLLGFFSVFNSDALKDVKLYKGGMPAEYGGRLSSVMDVRMKEGNAKELDISAGIGLISSKLTVEAPIVKDKGSFMISGRRTYADLFLKLSGDEDLQNTTLYFYDLNAKANYRFGDKDRIFLSGYLGKDNFGFSDNFGFDWGNTTGTLRWNHLYSDKLFSNTSLIRSNYNYSIDFGGDNGAQISSLIKDINLKQDFDWFANENNTLKFGANIIHHTFEPGEVQVSEEGLLNSLELEDKYALESAVYLSNQQKVSDRLSLNYGLRYSNFTQLGPGEIYTFSPEGIVSDTNTYSSWEAVQSYNGLAPRFTGTYLLDGSSSFKGSYARNYQYLHLLSNSSSGNPTDVWLPSSNNIQPEVSDQVAVGYFRNFAENQYEFSAEAYYKNMQNVIEFRTGADITLNPLVEGDLLYGKGRAYGLELFVKKRSGRLTGWLSYTLSRSERQFEDINEGAWFSARQDRTHDLSIVAMYDLSKRLTASATWVYYTGNAVTFPGGKYEIDGQVNYYYTERNGYRMPDYHRLDLGLTLNNRKTKMVLNPETGKSTEVPRKFNSSWNFSLYNAYGRENAYSITFRESEADPNVTEAVQLSLFKWVPSISYNFNF